MARRATMIVTPTRVVRLEVCERFSGQTGESRRGSPRPTFLLRPLPPNQAGETTRRLGIEDEFLLFVGTIEPRKNLLTWFVPLQKC